LPLQGRSQQGEHAARRQTARREPAAAAVVQVRCAGNCVIQVPPAAIPLPGPAGTVPSGTRLQGFRAGSPPSERLAAARVESHAFPGDSALAPRATWKGYVKIAELAFPTALYAGATTSQRVSFHILNRKTGNRVHRQYIDEETEKPVERDQQV